MSNIDLDKVQYFDKSVDLLTRHLPELRALHAANGGLGLESVDVVVNRLPKITSLTLTDNQIAQTLT